MAENKIIRKKARLYLRTAKGSVTVEMAYLLPVLLSVFFFTLYAVFYYHDKVIINGAAGETAVVGAQAARTHGESDVDLKSFYEMRVQGRLILLRLTCVSAEVGENEVAVSARASYGRMSASAKCRASVIRPEKKIRAKRRLEALAGKETD